jgi:hypothetical protein
LPTRALGAIRSRQAAGGEAAESALAIGRKKKKVAGEARTSDGLVGFAANPPAGPKPAPAKAGGESPVSAFALTVAAFGLPRRSRLG